MTQFDAGRESWKSKPSKRAPNRNDAFATICALPHFTSCRNCMTKKDITLSVHFSPPSMAKKGGTVKITKTFWTLCEFFPLKFINFVNLMTNFDIHVNTTLWWRFPVNYLHYNKLVFNAEKWKNSWRSKVSCRHFKSGRKVFKIQFQDTNRQV